MFATNSPLFQLARTQVGGCNLARPKADGMTDRTSRKAMGLEVLLFLLLQCLWFPPARLASHRNKGKATDHEAHTRNGHIAEKDPLIGREMIRISPSATTGTYHRQFSR